MPTDYVITQNGGTITGIALGDDDFGAGQKIESGNVIIGNYITGFTAKLYKIASPTGTIQAQLYRAGAAIETSSQTLSAENDVTNSYDGASTTDYSFVMPGQNLIQANDIIAITVSDSGFDSTNRTGIVANHSPNNTGNNQNTVTNHGMDAAGWISYSGDLLCTIEYSDTSGSPISGDDDGRLFDTTRLQIFQTVVPK